MQPVTVALPSLETWVAAILRRAGLDDESAGLAAARLLLADTTGVSTHGIARLPSYWRQLGRGGLKVRPNIEYAWRGTVLTIEADLGLGQVVGPRVIARALATLEPARPFVPFIIRNAGHLGALGSHLFDAVEQGKVAFLCQVTQPVMSPEGAMRPAIGNNPIAFAAPRRDGPPFVVDFAMSNVARGKLHVAQRDGLPIPPGWAIDPEGRPTTDVTAALAGSILPAAGHKGLALAMIVEVLAGALTGARPLLSEGGAPGGVGAFGFVLDPAEIAGPDAFDQTMRDWTSHYHTAAGAHGRIPGERAAELRAAAARDGIKIEEPLRLLLVELGETAGIAFPS